MTSDEQKSNQRPDIFAVISDEPTFIDIGIVQPSATSYRGKEPLARAKKYENDKIEKYKDLAMENDARIIPFIIESNGGYGEQAGHVLNDIKVFAHEEALAFAPSEVVHDMLDAVAIAVQKGNAMAIRSAWERMMHIRYEQQAVSTAQTLQSVDSRDATTDEYDEPVGGHDEMQRLSVSQSMTATPMIECVG